MRDELVQVQCHNDKPIWKIRSKLFFYQLLICVYVLNYKSTVLILLNAPRALHFMRGEGVVFRAKCPETTTAKNR